MDDKASKNIATGLTNLGVGISNGLGWLGFWIFLGMAVLVDWS